MASRISIEDFHVAHVEDKSSSYIASTLSTSKLLRQYPILLTGSPRLQLCQVYYSRLHGMHGWAGTENTFEGLWNSNFQICSTGRKYLYPK